MPRPRQVRPLERRQHRGHLHAPGRMKQQILDALRHQLEERLRVTQASAADAVAAATHEEARAEDKYDTRGLEQTYLAAGQNARMAELRQLLTSLHFYVSPLLTDRVQPGSLVLAAHDGQETLYLLLPFAVGERLQVAGQLVQVVGTAAPVAAALLGKQVGDVVTVLVAGQKRELEVVEVQ